MGSSVIPIPEKEDTVIQENEGNEDLQTKPCLISISFPAVYYRGLPAPFSVFHKVKQLLI